MATKVNIYAQTIAHLHGGATTFAQPHCTLYFDLPPIFHCPFHCPLLLPLQTRGST